MDNVEAEQLFKLLFEAAPGFISLFFLRRTDRLAERAVCETADYIEAARYALTKTEAGFDSYFSPAVLANRPKAGGRGKKEDFLGSRTLWVDVDATTHHPADEILRRLTGFQPPPSVVVHSGNGFHGYWLLRELITDKPAVEAANRWLAQELGGDQCFSIDHVLRVPGTLNYKGRAVKRD